MAAKASRCAALARKTLSGNNRVIKYIDGYELTLFVHPLPVVSLLWELEIVLLQESL